MAKTAALVLAGGRGIRAGDGLPKQYRPLSGQPMLRRTLAVFADHPRIDAVRAVIHPEDAALYAEAAAGLDLLAPVLGGATRQESSLRGLESLVAESPEKVLIQDAARPFTDAATIDRVLDALDHVPAALAAVPVTDTLKHAGPGDLVTATVDRSALWRAQTPQGFRYAAILQAHRGFAGAALTDDAAIAETAGLEVALVLGSEDNVKLTAAADFVRAERAASAADAGLAAPPQGALRIGSGFDVHRFGRGDHVMLCGIAVPHDQGLLGHSDADAGLHALTDAILGALGAGDIGQHFPPADPQWCNADSALFLRRASDMVAERGGAIGNLDITLICERPKIGPYREAMRCRIAAILGLDPARVSIKATTTERLGFTGRGEGIAAQAIVLVRL